MEVLSAAGMGLPVFGDVGPEIITRAAIVAEDSGDGKRQFSGWLTTEGVDRFRTVLTARGAKKRFCNYQANPILCWAHNHVKPIGTVMDPQLHETLTTRNGITAAGIFLNGATIMNSSGPGDNLDYFWMCVKEGTVRALSIGAMAYAVQKGEDAVGQIIRFMDYDTLEGSLAPIPMNPQALVTSKNLMKRTLALCSELEDSGEPITIEALGNMLLERGIDFELPTYHGVGIQLATTARSIPAQNEDVEKPAVVDADEDSPSQDSEARQAPEEKTMTLSYATNGTAVTPVTTAHRDYGMLKKSLFALQKGDNGVFPIGGIDDNGEPKLDLNMSLQALTFSLGARNTSATFDAEERMNAVDAICGSLRASDFAEYIPKAYGLPVDKLSKEVFKSMPYHAVEWPDKAAIAIETTAVAEALSQLSRSCAALNKSFKGLGSLVARAVYERYEIYVRPDNDRDRMLIGELTSLVGAYDKETDSVNEEMYCSKTSSEEAESEGTEEKAEASLSEEPTVSDATPATAPAPARRTAADIAAALTEAMAARGKKTS